MRITLYWYYINLEITCDNNLLFPKVFICLLYLNYSFGAFLIINKGMAP